MFGFKAKVVCALLLWVTVAGSPSHAGENGKVRVHFPGGGQVIAELALTPEQQARGLMFREKLGDHEGMLFLFGEEGVHSFWMKNMLISIDILWLDREGRIVHIVAHARPCRSDPCPSYTPVLPSRFVLEVKAGKSKELGLRPGDRLEFDLPLRTRMRILP